MGATTCSGNCPGGCNSCPCGTSSNYVSASTYCSKYSDWSQSCCQCIISHESGGNANAVNWSSCSGGSAPCNPTTNTNCAHMVWGWGGKNWSLWSTCGACGCCNKA